MMTTIQPLPSPKNLKKELPITIAQRDFIEQSRQQIRSILNKNDPRLLLIVGPCSIHDIKAAKEYAAKLRSLSDETADTFFIAMRVYFEKPRTALGWKGIMYDPYLDDSHDMNTGLRWTRQLLLDLADLCIPAAAEILDPISAHYFGDLLSWSCIGARTSSSQIHRQAASGLPLPVGFKNHTDGNIAIAVNGVVTAAHPHIFLGINESGCTCRIQTKGNKDSHIVLRGGEKAPNYDAASISQALSLLKEAKLPLRLVIDCSHDNSGRQDHQQPTVFHSVIEQIIAGNRHITGLIVESNLHAGQQPLLSDPSRLKYGISLTDPCIGWETTEQLVKEGKKTLDATQHAALFV